MPRILMLLPSTTYRASDFLAAAGRMNVEVVAASEHPSAMAQQHPETLLTLNLRDPDGCAQSAIEFHRLHPIDAVIPVDEETAIVAAVISKALGLSHNSVESVVAARNKHVLSKMLVQYHVATPAYHVFELSDDPGRVMAECSFPCVLKPVFLSGSRGVIRSNAPGEFLKAWETIKGILSSPEMQERGGHAASQILVQEFIPGREYALEGLMVGGNLRVLALFDKPDPLDGPFFEETIYVTPSRLPQKAQSRIADCVASGAAAIGLREGPIHAEVRLNQKGPWLIEIAARSIGGLCSRTLRFGTGLSLEEIILRHALGMPLEDLRREEHAAGVMMIPIPRSGTFERIQGLAEARAVAGVREVTITARPSQPIVALPEGSSYLGFIFAKGDEPSIVEETLRRAHAKLQIAIS